MRYKNTDAVAVKENVGKWIAFNDEWFDYFCCSECGHKEFKDDKDTCPKCGAKMERSNENAE